MDDFWKFAIVFTVVGVPVLGSMLWGLTDTWMKHRNRRLEIQAQLTAEKAAQYAAHTERLEQRMRVLERIITDRGVAVAEEIENLRDTPLH
jgi:hypothetical protein